MNLSLKSLTEKIILSILYISFTVFIHSPFVGGSLAHICVLTALLHAAIFSRYLLWVLNAVGILLR